jgi:hypothetical protein
VKGRNFSGEVFWGFFGGEGVFFFEFYIYLKLGEGMAEKQVFNEVFFVLG